MSVIRGSQISSTSLALTGSIQGTASYAVTASYALNGGGGGNTFPYAGNAVITGSLLVSGSGLTVTGSVGVSGGITGSLQGTASYADYATTASYVASPIPAIWVGVLTLDTSSLGTLISETYNNTTGVVGGIARDSIGVYTISFDNDYTVDVAKCLGFITTKLIRGQLFYEVEFVQMNQIRIRTYDSNGNVADGLGTAVYFKIEVYP